MAYVSNNDLRDNADGILGGKMLEVASFVALAAIVYLIRQVGILSSRVESLEKLTEAMKEKDR